MRPLIPVLSLTATLLAALPTIAHATTITYGVSELSSSTGILGGSSGLVSALHFQGGNGSTADLNLNLAGGAVVFHTINPGGNAGGFGDANMAGGGDINSFLNNSQWGTYGLTLTGLTGGANYRLQIIGYASNSSHTADVNLGGQHYNFVVDTTTDHTKADMLTATWTQDIGQTSMILNFGNNPQISGLVLHSLSGDTAVPLPATWALLGIGALALRSTRRSRPGRDTHA